MKKLIYKYVMHHLSHKRLWWSKRVKIYCDAGFPIFTWIPKYRRQNFDPAWKLSGFAIYWLGREFNFVFGEDKEGFYGQR